ncbi:MAG: ABC transporter substrate-binding protein, partial [Anaerovoracaceae bacterium]
MRKRIIMLALAVVMLAGTVFMTGCGKAKNDGDTLVYGSQDYSSINPALYEHGEINALIFAGLTAHDENNKVVPGLAESWDFDEATLTYHFKLKKDLTFHDGKPLTSADVKFTLETILDEKNQSEIVSNYKDIESIDCPDESTVQIKLKTRNIAMPDYLT